MGHFPCGCCACTIFESAPWEQWTGGTVSGDALRLTAGQLASTDAMSVASNYHETMVWVRNPLAYGYAPSSIDINASLRVECTACQTLNVVITDQVVTINGSHCAPEIYWQPTTATPPCGIGELPRKATQARLRIRRCDTEMRFIVELLDALNAVILTVQFARVVSTTAQRQVRVQNMGGTTIDLVAAKGFGELAAEPKASCRTRCQTLDPCDPLCFSTANPYQLRIEVSGFPATHTVNATIPPSTCGDSFVITGLDALNGTYVAVSELDPSCGGYRIPGVTWNRGNWSGVHTYCGNVRNYSGPMTITGGASVGGPWNAQIRPVCFLTVYFGHPSLQPGIYATSAFLMASANCGPMAVVNATLQNGPCANVLGSMNARLELLV